MASTLFIAAVKAGDRPAAEFRLQAGDAVDQRDGRDRTALMYAAEAGAVESVTWLLDHGASVEAAVYPPDGGTALEFAISGGHTVVVEVLLARGARASGAALNYAAALGQVAIVDALLDRGAPVTRNPDGSTALIKLSGFGPEHARPLPVEALLPTVQRLVKRGADVNARDAQGETALLAAVRSGNLPLVELLLTLRAEVSAPDSSAASLLAVRDAAMLRRLLAVGVAEETRRWVFWRYVRAERRDLAEVLARCLPAAEQGPLLGGLRLLAAVGAGNADAVRATLAATSPGLPGSAFGAIALVTALRSWRPEVRHRLVDLLLEAGVPANGVERGTTPLIAAVAMNDPALVKRLLAAGADINLHPEGGDSALMMAAGSGDYENERAAPSSRFDPAVDALVRLLLAAGSDVRARGSGGRTVLHYAIRRYPHNLARLLEAGADVNQADDEGWAPLVAADEGVAKLLLAAGADVHQRTRSGQTALHLCTSVAKAELLVAKGADVEARDAKGNTPLLAHAAVGRSELVRWLAPRTANLDAANTDGATALLFAALLGREEDALFLAERGVRLAVQSRQGVTVLHGAGRNGLLRLARLALEHGAAVDARDGEGETALMGAAAFGHEELVRLLLARGAGVQLRNARGFTAWKLAQIFGRTGVAEILEAAGGG